MFLDCTNHRWAFTQGLLAQHEPPQRIPGSTVVRRFHLLEVVGAQQLGGGASSLASGSQCGSFGRRRDDRLLAEQRGRRRDLVWQGYRRIGPGQVSDVPRERRRQGGMTREADRHPGGVVAVPHALISAPGRTGHGVDAAIRMNWAQSGGRSALLSIAVVTARVPESSCAQRLSPVASASRALAAGEV
jgi:hypothetical protein